MNVGQILETHLGWAAKAGGEDQRLLEKLYSVDQLKKELKRLYAFLNVIVFGWGHRNGNQKVYRQVKKRHFCRDGLFSMER